VTSDWVSQLGLQWQAVVVSKDQEMLMMHQRSLPRNALSRGISREPNGGLLSSQEYDTIRKCLASLRLIALE